jgi:hypothetical protein
VGEERKRGLGDPDAISCWRIRREYRPVNGADEGAQVVGGGTYAAAELGGERLHEARYLVQVRRHGGPQLFHRLTRAAELSRTEVICVHSLRRSSTHAGQAPLPYHYRWPNGPGRPVTGTVRGRHGPPGLASEAYRAKWAGVPWSRHGGTMGHLSI